MNSGAANAEVSLAGALDQPGLVFTTGGSAPWQAMATPDAPWDGVDAAVVSPAVGSSGFLTTTVTGPARVRFVAGIAFAHSLSLTLPGMPADYLEEGENGFYVGTGSQTVRWSVSSWSSSLTGTSMLDGLRIDFLPPVDAAVLLGPSGATAGAGSSAVLATESRDGNGAVRLIPGVGESIAWVAAPATGARQISLWLRADAGSTIDLTTAVKVLVDGMTVPFHISPPGEAGWRRLTAWQVQPGDVSVRIETTTELAADDWKMLPVALVSPESAVDVAGVLNFTDVTGAFGIQTSNIGAAGSHALLFRSTGTNAAGLTAVISGPATLGMWVLSLDGYFRPAVTMDGGLSEFLWHVPASRPAEDGLIWRHRHTHIPAGTHVMHWSVPAGSSYPAREPWVDDITVTPDLAVTLAEALDLPDAALTAGPPEAWQGWRSPSLTWVAGDDDVAIVTPGAGTAWLEVAFAGPAWVQSWLISSRPANTTRTLLDGQPLTGEWVETPTAPGGRLHVLRIELTGPAATISSITLLSQLREVPLNAVSPLPLRFYSENSDDVWQALDFPASDILYWPDGISLFNNRGQLATGYSRSYVETTVPSPGILTDLAYADSVFIDGKRISFSGIPYRFGGIPLAGAGPHTIRWEWDDGFPAMLPQFDVIPATASLEAAFGVPGSVLTSGGDRQWSTLPLAEPAGAVRHILACPMLGAGERSWLEAEIAGPGRLDFSWETRNYNGTTWVDLDGAPALLAPNPHTWQPRGLSIPPGSHRVRWIAVDSSTSPLYSRDSLPLLLDAVRFTPQAVAPSSDPSIQDALDLEAATEFTTGGAVATVRAAGIGHNDAVSLTSGAVHAPSFVETTITGPARVTFDVKGSVRLRADGIVMLETGSSDWKPVAFDLGTGSHTVRWEVPPPPYPAPGAELSWLSRFCLLDRVTLTPLPAGEVSPVDAVDFSLSFAMSSGPDFRGQSDITWDGIDALLVNGYRLYFSVEGPGMLTFRQLNVARNFTDASGANPVVDLEPPDAAGWQLRGLELPPGRQSIDLNFMRQDFEAPAYFDSFQLLQPRPSSLGAAVEAAHLEWTTSPAAPWEPVSVPGMDAASSPVTYEPSWIQTTVTGPGVLSFFLQAPYFPPEANLQNQNLIFVTVDGYEWRPKIDRQPQHNRLRIESAGTHCIRWMTRPMGYGLDTLIRLDSVSFAPLSGDDSYAVWRAVHGLPGTQGGPENDDADGLGPLVEYAFGLDPLTPDDLTGASHLPVSSFTTFSGEKYLTLTCRRRRTDPGLRHVPEFSGDARRFLPSSSEPASITPLDSFWEEVTFTDPVPVSASSRRFGRVRISWEAVPAGQ